MAVSRRQFFSGMLYELGFRAKRGIPLPARPLMNLLIKSAIARTQRDYKVVLCNYVWMGNHPHLTVISLDIKELTAFYGEVKKRITESVKRLLGLDHLVLWEESGTNAPVLLDLETAIKRHVYMFNNPTAAHLVTSIDRYPGLSTWKAFRDASPSVKSEVTEQVPWIRMGTIPGLKNPEFSRNEEQRIISKLLQDDGNKELFPLILSPLAWLAVFGITEPEQIEACRAEIVERVRANEASLAEERTKAGKGVVGAKRLLEEGISFDHIPKKKERRIFVITSINERRIDWILRFRVFCEECRVCYQLMRLGHTNIEWPPGAFVPPAPLLMNPLRS